MKKRFLSIVLTLALVLSLMPAMSLPAAAAANGKAIRLVQSGAAAYILGAQESNVYFGNYMQDDANSKKPIKWRVLSNADGKLFLLSDQNLDACEYNTERESTTWKTSFIRSWLNDYDMGPYAIGLREDRFINTAFAPMEQDAIAETNVVNNDNEDWNTSGGENTTDKIFLLSIEEVQNEAYGFDEFDEETRASTNTAYANDAGAEDNDVYWLRSPGMSEDCAATVGNDGEIHTDGDYVSSYIVAVRPAFNLDLNSILFASAATGGKSGTLGKIGDYTGSDWKLTLLDTDRHFAVTETTASAAPGGKVTLNYTGATTGTNEYISAMLLNSAGEATYYGRLAQPTSAAGEVEITIPADLAAGAYTLKVFNEQYNGDYKTDYSSAFSNVSLTVTAGDGIAYIERSWNGNEVAKADRNCTSYSVVSSGSKTWNAGWYVVNANTTISSAITVSGDVHLILCDNVTLTAQKGIAVNGKGNNSLTIYGQSGDTGKLVATGATGYPLGAGIGGVSGDIYQNACGTVIIHGGTVSATGEDFYCAGIGGMGSNVGTVTVYGGKVTATGKDHGAGIVGTVTVYGGEVTANGNYEAGIDGGNNTVTIFGGTIKATSNKRESIRGKVTVNGGSVTAISNGDEEEIGIGGDALTVNGGTVTATGKYYGAGISSSAVTVNGGKVTATGGQYGPGISGGTLTVTGGEVFATGRYNCAGIVDAVTVNGGKVTAVGGNSYSPAGISGDVSFGEDFVGGVRAGASEAEAVYMTKQAYTEDHSANYVTMPVDAPTVATIVETGTSYDSVQTAINAAGYSQTVRMEKDVTENLSVAGDKIITLDLNGKVLTGSGNGSVVVVDGMLTLADSAPAAMHDNRSLPAGGIITGGTGSHVEEFVVGISGGGVLVNEEGSFTMTGGTITGNSARYGGGVYVSNEADFTMTGGTITGNTVFESGEFGGEPAGGGVYFKAPGFFKFITLGGTAKIIENSGSNLYLGDGSAIQIREYGDNAPAQGMSVGVTTENEPYEGTPVTFAAYALSTDAKYFFADNEDYAVAFGYDDHVRGGDCLQLVVPQEKDKYPVWIGGTQISRFNKDDVLRDGGSVSFDPDTNTLTLNNTIIGADAESDLREAIKSQLPKGKTLTVNLIGTNVIGRAPDEEYEEYTVKTGLYIDKSMTRAALPDGSLLLIGDENSSLTVYARRNGIEGGDIRFGEDGTTGKKFEGELKIFSNNEAIKSHKSVFANGGNIFMKSQDEVISAEQNVAVSGGKLTIRAERRGIEAENVTLSGGEIDVTAKSEGVHAGNDVTLSGVTLDVTGGENYSAIYASGRFSITDIDCQIIARGDNETYGAICSGSAPSFAAGLTMLGSTDKNAAKENITATAQMVASEEEYPYGAYIGTEPANAVTFNFEKVYTVTVEANGHGSASADVTEGVSGTEVTLTVNADSGYEVDAINVIRGGVTVSGNKFTIGTEDVEIQVTFKETPPETYNVIVEDDGHGTASANPTSAVPDAEVTLSAAPFEGYAFKEWQVIHGGVTITDNKFTMPASEVKVKAIFERVYAITVLDDGHGTAAASPNPATANAIVTLTATPNGGYAFEKWETVSGSVVITNNVFVMPASNVTVKAVFSEKMSSVITPPAANSLIYHGTTQTLVTPGAAQNGTMFYAIGEDSGTAPIKGWLKDIPTGKNAGTYCVWYKSVGDEGYADSIPECVEVIVSKAPLSIDTAVIADKVYDGTTTAQVTSVTFGGLLGDDRLAPGTDYSVSGVFDSPDYKGDHPATKVTVTVTLLATDAASNYRMTGPKDFEKTISAPADPTTPIIFPEEAHILVGQQATFTVQTTGEGLSYQWYINRNTTGEGLSYQWYINRNDGRGWRKLKNATGTSYTTPVVDLDYDGFRYYCLVTDRYGNEVNSKIAVLHVSAQPKTGDSFRMILWLAMSMLSVLTILLIRRRETKD